MYPARMSPIRLFKSTGLCAMVLWLAACSAEVDAIHTMTPPSPSPAPDLSFTCVHSRDADIPVTPEAQALFDKARALEKAPGPKDFDTIARTYEQAVALGHWKAMQNVQILYYQGLTTHPAPALRVTELNEKLIALGAAIGYYNMANNLETGYGVKQDKKAALAYYRKSADLGSPDGQAYVGNKLIFGFNKDDIGKAMLECAVAQNSSLGAKNLADYHLIVSKDLGLMLQALQKSTELGNSMAAFGLYKIFKTGNTDISEHAPIAIDIERTNRYLAIYNTLKRNPHVKIPEINSIVPLPPAPLPKWDGSFSFQRQPSAQ
ncbi:DUF6396 domain-containing protein [Comamonas sp. NoAH]|uniref:SEL1-like repeat protein n=1 Tax=Comamonas halotolerans TaxID=3041496 RepID=UPI0024E0899F|nr:DUF6396 domain-containing protein [Comamonas sp. NoAH]